MASACPTRSTLHPGNSLDVIVSSARDAQWGKTGIKIVDPNAL